MLGKKGPARINPDADSLADTDRCVTSFPFPSCRPRDGALLSRQMRPACRRSVGYFQYEEDSLSRQIVKVDELGSLDEYKVSNSLQTLTSHHDSIRPASNRSCQMHKQSSSELLRKKTLSDSEGVSIKDSSLTKPEVAPSKEDTKSSLGNSKEYAISVMDSIEKTQRFPEKLELPSTGTYKRELPSTGLTAFSSPEGRKMLQDAMAKGSAEAYFPIAEQFLTQSDPPSCGPATISLVLNSLMVDPKRVWKAPWRWYTEDMLQACTPIDFSKGVTMEEFAHLATCNYLKVQMRYAEDEQLGIEKFRQDVRRVCCDKSGDSRIVIAFSRSRLGQTGSGHYSPIGAYHEDSDSVLVMDVARFKYPPYWVPLERLWAAMEEIDPMTFQPRGFFVLERQETAETESGETHACGHGHQKSIQRSDAPSPIKSFDTQEALPCKETLPCKAIGQLETLQGDVAMQGDVARRSYHLEADVTTVLSHWLKTQPEAAERVLKRLKDVASEVSSSRSYGSNPQDAA